MSDISEPKNVKSTVVAYLAILALAALQLSLAARGSSIHGHIVQMVLIACIQAAIAGFTFTEIGKLKGPRFFLIVVAPVVALLLMNVLWSDSFRVFTMHP